MEPLIAVKQWLLSVVKQPRLPAFELILVLQVYASVIFELLVLVSHCTIL